MNFTTRGTTLTVHTSHGEGTVSVARTADQTPLITLTLAEAHELAPLLNRVLKLTVSNPTPSNEHQHPFGVA